MPIRGAQPLTFRAFGVCDAVDGSNAPQGAMSSLANLVPSPTTKRHFVPRPAATQTTNFTGFTTPGQGEALLVIGNRAYGMIASARFAGKSEPFCYDLTTAAFVSIGNVTTNNCPTSQPTVGDWTAATMTMVGARILVTHPGFNGATTFIGWIDVRAFTLATTGATHSNTTLDGLVSTIGVQVGDLVTGTGIPANTYVVDIPTTASVTLSQAATATAAGVAITFASGTVGAPVWGAGQVAGSGRLTAVPTAVAQFNGRAYYAVGNKLQYSDALTPLAITNATQSLTLGDSTAITALGGLPLGNLVAGGVAQALIAFKDSRYFQITGDQATTNLRADEVAGSVGTRSPNSICPTPFGLAYAAADGIRFVGLDGKSSDPVGADGDGVAVPFMYANNPTRIAAAYGQGVLRFSVQNGYRDGQPNEEYWYDIPQRLWTGPHSFPAGLIQPYHNGVNSFIMFALGVNAKLWQSATNPTGASTYTENGAALTWTWRTTLLPDNEQGRANQVVQTALGLAMPSGQAVTLLAQDENGLTLDTVSLSSVAMAGAVWGSFLWGAGIWGGAVLPYQEYAVPWHNALVFKQMTLQVNGQSVGGFAIGNLYAQIQPTGYLGAHGT